MQFFFNAILIAFFSKSDGNTRDTFILAFSMYNHQYHSMFKNAAE